MEVFAHYLRFQTNLLLHLTSPLSWYFHNALRKPTCLDSRVYMCVCVCEWVGVCRCVCGGEGARVFVEH